MSLILANSVNATFFAFPTKFCGLRSEQKDRFASDMVDCRGGYDLDGMKNFLGYFRTHP